MGVCFVLVVLGQNVDKENYMTEISSEENAYSFGWALAKHNELSETESFIIDILQGKWAWVFLRGLFDCTGTISLCSDQPMCMIMCSGATKRAIENFCTIPSVSDSSGIAFYGNSALDFLGNIYSSDMSIYNPDKKNTFVKMCSFDQFTEASSFLWSKTRLDAIRPTKSRSSDSGYDLVILQLAKKIGTVELWDTGIKVCPPFGWYFDMVPRSSIIKTGYILANSTGVIDRTYTGSIMVPLLKIDSCAPDMPPGSRVVQIIPRPAVHFLPIYTDDLNKTDRGNGGFGSTG